MPWIPHLWQSAYRTLIWGTQGQQHVITNIVPPIHEDASSQSGAGTVHKLRSGKHNSRMRFKVPTANSVLLPIFAHLHPKMRRHKSGANALSPAFVAECLQGIDLRCPRSATCHHQCWPSSIRSCAAAKVMQQLCTSCKVENTTQG